MKADVFLSYSRRDGKVVLDLADRLRQKGVSIWIDQSEVEGASRWREEVVVALQSCRVVLLFLSGSAILSDNIAKEISIASEDNKPILPVYLEAVKIPRSLRYQLAGLQHIEWHRGDQDTNFRAITRALTRVGVIPSDGWKKIDEGHSGMPEGLESRLGVPPQVFRREGPHRSILEALRGTGSRLAVQGLPGIGKTALLCDIARSVAKDYQTVAVVKSDGPSATEPGFCVADLNEAATSLECGLSADTVSRLAPKDALKALAARLTDHPVLILVDGAESEEGCQGVLDAFGREGRSRLVVALRQRPSSRVPSFVVPPLTDSESVSFATHITQMLSLDIDPAEVVSQLPVVVRSHPQALATLLAQLGDLPLSLLLDAGLTEEAFMPIRLVRKVIESLDEPTRRVLGLVAVLSGLNLSLALKILGISATPASLHSIQVLLARSLIYRNGDSFMVPELVRTALIDADPAAWNVALREATVAAGRSFASIGGGTAEVAATAAVGCGVVQSLAAGGQWYQIGKLVQDGCLELLNARGCWKEYSFLLRHAVEAAAKTGDRRSRVRLGCRLARKLLQTGDMVMAGRMVEEAEKIGADPGSIEQAELHSHRGLIHQMSGGEIQALNEWEQSRVIRKKLGDAAGKAVVERMMGEVCIRRAMPGKARSLLRSALSVLKTGEDQRQLLEVETSLATCDLAMKNFSAATRRLKKVLRGCTAHQYEPGQPRALLTLAMVELAQGQSQHAMELMKQAASFDFDKTIRRSAQFLLDQLRDQPAPSSGIKVDPVTTMDEYERGIESFTARLDVEWSARVEEWWSSVQAQMRGEVVQPRPAMPALAAEIGRRLREFCVLNGRDLDEVDKIEQKRVTHYSQMMIMGG